ncbi:Osmotically-inducible protein Y precursor [Raoultella terrigena]|uniref:Osmotically-inducible protein Y n=1 Tax=Raoultella terrigena TaxID=577 RepID=A0A4U9D8G8_RAOTE|nr:Osmotically-inducible protein Y precursor [Raoultella terrigena]
MNKVGDFMDDSTITARVKAALIDDKSIRSTDISVKTENKAVTLSGSVESTEQKEQAVKIAKEVKGVSDGQRQAERRQRAACKPEGLRWRYGDYQ